ncbi:PAT1 multi-domain protein [Pyrenophora tritici-repentis]|uniref:Vesicle coat complex COPII, subunit SEC24-subunit SFB2-subunit SFB3 n=2 Tax=Pyrenophora tritici-repentis TaxID=45151 RepID=A0A2W1EZ21_9PLEO|nr:uncharacterized protein PTRG_10046 [Pyrenophora tritici-repentis Pt-1C-BFP]KAA8621547.1 hypothetical protein PtrV1_06048 [Pyrenophora tritici-repentis]EDU43097.1 predicted protein [Pyrenophora tritici-repentis Pt-1C-BFP]KAF7450787.1 hypothetical protein A1F99_054030 [Pyrenophora tritici-repentis]KAF7573438.1 Vesicle coat complex COPII, subunit SEC24-subunit SFB2-subunit SFB3 [Pyrenophora tritici-repentis]KAG9380999.1 hypothetical protein A1F94_008319 [Pyrenophora tritici-repentis]
MPRLPKNNQQGGSSVTKVTKKRQTRRKTSSPPSSPSPPPTTHWSDEMGQTLNFGRPVPFQDNWRPSPPAPAPQPQQHGVYAQGPFPGQAQNEHSVANTHFYSYTAQESQGYGQVQGTQNNFAAPSQQQPYFSQDPQMVFAAQMQPQGIGTYQTHNNFAAPTQQQPYPQIQGMPNTLAAMSEQQEQNSFLPLQEPSQEIPAPLPELYQDPPVQTTQQRDDVSAPTAPDTIDPFLLDTSANVPATQGASIPDANQPIVAFTTSSKQELLEWIPTEPVYSNPDFDASLDVFDYDAYAEQ